MNEISMTNEFYALLKLSLWTIAVGSVLITTYWKPKKKILPLIGTGLIGLSVLTDFQGFIEALLNPMRGIKYTEILIFSIVETIISYPYISFACAMGFVITMVGIWYGNIGFKETEIHGGEK